MGLDLVLENRNEKVYGNNEWHELAYGRKTWVIANFFRNRNEPIDGDWLYHVTRESWAEFIATVHPYMTNADFLAVINRCTNVNYRSNSEDTKRLEAVLNALDEDSWAQLGPEWEVRTVMDWYNSNFEVQEAFNRGDDIRLVVSY